MFDQSPQFEETIGRLDAAQVRKVIVGASLGTVFEWYDFFVYALLASVLSRQFFAGIDETSAYIVTLLSFAAGTAIRPLGALAFGCYGDMMGRKRTFLITITLMGVSTFCIGLLPGYRSWGAISAFLLVGLRLIQGFALGGEYGGAAIYVAEHSPSNRRGFYTSFIQMTTPFGQLLAMLVFLVIHFFVKSQDFDTWGWRILFLISIVMLLFSIRIRSSFEESPIFRKMKEHGTLSKAPLKEVFLKWENFQALLVALFGLAAGQAVVINVGMTYSFFFLAQTLKLDFETVNFSLAIALLITAPFFVVFGALSDKIGRKPIIMVGLMLAAISYRPIFHGLMYFGNPTLQAAQATSPVRVIADSKTCSFQFNPTGTARFRSSCDVAKGFLSKRGVPYTNVEATAGSLARIAINGSFVDSIEGKALTEMQFHNALARKNIEFDKLVTGAGYLATAESKNVNKTMLVILLCSLMISATMVYGPMGAFLVEIFPAQIRFSSVSTAYNIGNGWFGGFTSPIAFALIVASGDLYAGLWYCIAVTAFTFVVGVLFLRPRGPHSKRHTNPEKRESSSS